MPGYEIEKITQVKAITIIETREPRGLFYTTEGEIYVGIDNQTGDAWTEEFKSLSTCKRWLYGVERGRSNE